MHNQSKLYKSKETGKIISAVQWFKNGDHPNDDCFRPYEATGKIPTEMREGSVVRYFRHPDISGNSTCGSCGCTMHEHGWIDSGGNWQEICPGDYVILDETYDKPNYVRRSTVEFLKYYEPIEEKEQGIPKEDSFIKEQLDLIVRYNKDLAKYKISLDDILSKIKVKEARIIVAEDNIKRYSIFKGKP